MKKILRRTKSRKTKAFTLLELLLVIGIIVIITTASLSSGGRSGEVFRFNVRANEILQVLREARAQAISSLNFQPSEQGSAPYAPNYGINFHTGDQSSSPPTAPHVALFADTGSAFGEFDTSDQVLKKIDLTESENIKIKTDGTDLSGNSLDVIFVSPLGFVAEETDFSTIEVTFKNSNSTLQKKFFFHAASGVFELLSE
jgi:type II secretory pathway pseudopilin PulG